MVKLGDRHGLNIDGERANSDVPQGNWGSVCEGAERRLGDVSRFVEAQEQAVSSSLAPAADIQRDEEMKTRALVDPVSAAAL